MNPADYTFEEAIILIQDHGYDEHSPSTELLSRLAWKSFGFGLDLGLGSDAPAIPFPSTPEMTEVRQRLEDFHEIFLAASCQEALTETARTGNVTKLGAAVHLHVTRYLDDHGIGWTDVDEHRVTHAVALSTFCLCSSLQMIQRDRPLAEVYWHEACRARGDASES